MKHIFHYIGIAIALVLCVSCSSVHHLNRTKSERQELSQKFGFNIGKRDYMPLYREAATWLGTPYRYGGNSRQGIDCSGLVKNIYQSVYHKNLSRTTTAIARNNCRKKGKSNLQTGDLVFFNTSSQKRKGVNHVGIFLKNSYFIHASTSRGVIISNLHDKYYRKTWKFGGKVK